MVVEWLRNGCEMVARWLQNGCEMVAKFGHRLDMYFNTLLLVELNNWLRRITTSLLSSTQLVELYVHTQAQYRYNIGSTS